VKRSNRLMLLVGVLLAVVAFGGVLMFGSRSGSSGPSAPQNVSVVTALREIPLGTVLVPEDLGTAEWPTTDAVDTFVSYLRRKLEAGGRPRILHTVRGVGLKLSAPE